MVYRKIALITFTTSCFPLRTSENETTTKTPNHNHLILLISRLITHIHTARLRAVPISIFFSCRWVRTSFFFCCCFGANWVRTQKIKELEIDRRKKKWNDLPYRPWYWLLFNRFQWDTANCYSHGTFNAMHFRPLTRKDRTALER